MPIQNDTFIETKAILVKERQSALHLMHEEPWSVDELTIDPEGEILVKFYKGPRINVGRLKSKYNFLLHKQLQVLRWRVTGGEAIPGYVSEMGVRLRAYGLNLRLLIVTDKAQTLPHVRRVSEQA